MNQNCQNSQGGAQKKYDQKNPVITLRLGVEIYSRLKDYSEKKNRPIKEIIKEGTVLCLDKEEGNIMIIKKEDVRKMIEEMILKDDMQKR